MIASPLSETSSPSKSTYFPKLTTCCCSTVQCLQATLDNMKHPERLIYEELEPDLQDISKREPSDSVLHHVADVLLCVLTVVIPQLKSTSHSQIPQSDPYSSVGLSEDGQTVKDKILQFITFLRYYAHFTVVELLHMTILLTRLLSLEFEKITRSAPTIVSFDNLGTLLVCSAMIAVKLNRDASVKNTWWAKMFGISLRILNESELVFLQSIDYMCSLHSEEYHRLLRYILALSTVSKAKSFTAVPLSAPSVD